MISIISPVYNSEACLDKLVFKKFKFTKKNFKKIEIVLVDDGSKDNSWKKIKSLKKKYRFIKGIKLKKNFGQHEAIFTGIKESSFGIIVVMDCDLQDDPKFISKMYDKYIETNKPIIIKHSYINYSLKNRLVSNLFWYFLSIISLKNFSPYLGNYLLIDEKIKKKYLKSKSIGYLYGDLILQKNNFNFIEKKRSFGLRKKTTYNFRKLINLAIKLILKYNIISRIFFQFKKKIVKKILIEKII